MQHITPLGWEPPLPFYWNLLLTLQRTGPCTGSVCVEPISLGDALNPAGDGGAVQRVNGCTERSNARAAVKIRSRSGKTLALESVPQFQLLQHCRRRPQPCWSQAAQVCWQLQLPCAASHCASAYLAPLSAPQVSPRAALCQLDHNGCSGARAISSPPCIADDALTAAFAPVLQEAS